MVTYAKYEGDKAIHGRRLIQKRIVGTRSKSIANELIHTIAPQYSSRNGGYTRVIKLENRKNDDALKALIEFVDLKDLSGNDNSDDKKTEYLEVFEKYFLKSFSSRLAEYTDPKIRVESQKKLNEKYTMVSSVLLATEDKPEVKIDWRIVTKNPEKPLIIDVVIEGVSLAKVQKEEFNSIIQSNNGDINALLKSLKEFVNK